MGESASSITEEQQPSVSTDDKERASHIALQSEISYCEQAIQAGM